MTEEHVADHMSRRYLRVFAWGMAGMRIHNVFSPARVSFTNCCFRAYISPTHFTPFHPHPPSSHGSKMRTPLPL